MIARLVLGIGSSVDQSTSHERKGPDSRQKFYSLKIKINLRLILFIFLRLLKIPFQIFFSFNFVVFNFILQQLCFVVIDQKLNVGTAVFIMNSNMYNLLMNTLLLYLVACYLLLTVIYSHITTYKPSPDSLNSHKVIR